MSSKRFTSHLMKCRFLWLGEWMCRISPVSRLSTTTTSFFGSSASLRARSLAINPAPPVTRIRDILLWFAGAGKSKGTSTNLASASTALCADPSGKRCHSVIRRCSSVSYRSVTSLRLALAAQTTSACAICSRFIEAPTPMTLDGRPGCYKVPCMEVVSCGTDPAISACANPQVAATQRWRSHTSSTGWLPPA